MGTQMPSWPGVCIVCARRERVRAHFPHWVGPRVVVSSGRCAVCCQTTFGVCDRADCGQVGSGEVKHVCGA